MSHSISTLLRRNLRDVFGETTKHVGAHENRLWHRKTKRLGLGRGLSHARSPGTFIYRLTPSTFSAASMTGVFGLAWQ